MRHTRRTVAHREVSNEQLRRVAPFFEDNLTLSSLTLPQLTAMCRYMVRAGAGRSV